MSNERYLVLEENIRSLSFHLESVTRSKFDTDWHSTMHSHPFMELFYVIDGRGEFIVENERFSVKSQDFVIINPHVEHTEMSSREHPMEYIVLGISGLSFSKQAKKDFVDSPFDLPFSFFNFRDEQKEILHYLNAIVREATRQEQSYELVCHNLLEIVLVQLLRNQVFGVEVTPTSKTTRHIRLMKHYMKAHFHDTISLEDIANFTHLSKFYIAHTFKKETGMTIVEYITKLRIDESQVLLATTNLSIAQIATIVGFPHQGYFSKQFKERTGLRPNDYRKLYATTKKEDIHDTANKETGND